MYGNATTWPVNGRLAESLRTKRILRAGVLDQELRIQGGSESTEVDVDEIRGQGQALQRTPPFPGSKHAAVGVFVGDFRLQITITKNMLFHLLFRRGGIFNNREGLDGAGEQFAQ